MHAHVKDVDWDLLTYEMDTCNGLRYRLWRCVYYSALINLESD